MELPGKYHYAPYVGAFLYGICTPIGTCDVVLRGGAVSLRVSASGIAVGLGVRTTYNPDSTTASIVSGVMDALSAGILIYTGLVELLAHEFLFNKEMNTASNKKLTYACLCMLFGAGIMALLGRWA